MMSGVSTPSPIPSDTSQLWVTEFVKLIPWAKLTAPMLPVIYCIYWVGRWLSDLYKFNVVQGMVGGFPAAIHMTCYLVAALLVCGAYLWLSISHVKQNIKSIS